MKIYKEMEVAACHTLLTLLTLFTWFTVDIVYTVDTVDTVYTIQTALHCLNSSMYACILFKKVRTLLEWTDALLSKMWEWVSGLDGVDTP